jgi:flagellar basal body-associated protein FliL
MNWILLNIPLGVVMVALAAGLPAWVLWKFPEGDDNTAQTAAPQSGERTAPAGRNIYQQAAELYSSAAA